MRAAALLTAFVVAKLAVVPFHLWSVSPWAPIAFLWQDALAALLFFVVDRALVRTRFSRALSVVFWLLLAYVALNVPVGRALATPLTWVMLRAAGGPLADSFRLYLTLTNALLMATVLAVGFLPAAFRRLTVLRPTRRRAVLAAAAIALMLTLGPIASARVDTFGFDRNVLAALVSSALPRVVAERRDRDWRVSPLATPAPADGLARLNGIGAGANIIVVSLESTAAQYLGIYGARPDPTPNLSALARNAVVFDAAYALYPESIKGLFSVLCSSPLAFDTPVDVYARLPCRSFASALKERGYRTALFHSGRFDYLGMHGIVEERDFETLEDAGAIGGVRESSFGVEDHATVRRMLDWMDRAPRQPFLITYLPISGHHPYEAPRGPFGSASEIERYRNALYDGDTALRSLIDGIRQRGLERNTVWVLYGDHGEAFGQHIANFGHTFYLYDENVRVPFVIAAPGRLEGTTHVGRTVSLMDTAPTILDLAGVAAPAEYQGRSMLRPDTGMALFFTDYSLPLAGLRDGPWKYVLEVGAERSELYNIRNDPSERANLFASQPERVARYRAHVESWIAAEKAQILARSHTRK